MTAIYDLSPALLAGHEEAAEQQERWNFLSHLVVRRAGFSFDWLEQLRLDRSAALANELLARQRKIDDLARLLLSERFPSAVAAAQQAGDRRQLKALSALRRKAGHRTLTSESVAQHQDHIPAALAAALTTFCDQRDQLAALHAQAEQTLETELQERRARLREIAGDPFFQEAVFLSNPDMYQNSLQPALRDPERPFEPAFERKIMAYLQRFSGKNDTASFFGPLNCGRIVTDQREPLLIERKGVKYSRRDAFISFWVANLLAEQISAEPGVQPHLRPRIHPRCRWEGETLFFPARKRRVRLAPLQQAILARADGATTIAVIAAAVGQPITQVAAEIARLVFAKALICRLEIPSTIFHPFNELLRLVEALPADWERRAYWRDQLGHFEDLRRQFVVADLPARQQILNQMDAHFTALTGQPPRRGAGRTYADRMLFYEECAGTFETFQFGGEWFNEFQRRLEPILDLCAAHGALLRQHYQALGKQVFQEISPGGAPVAYAEFIAAIQERQQAGQFPAASPELERFGETFRRLIQQRSDGRVARLNAADIAELLADTPWARNCHISPDVMLSARDIASLARGDYQVVLGEVHQVIYVWGSQLYFYPQRRGAEAEIAGQIGRMPEYAGLATVLNERQHKGLLSDAFPGVWIEAQARPADLDRERVPLAELLVELREDRLALFDRRTGQELRIYTAGDEQLHLWALALPRVMPVAVRMGVHTPRIELDGAVYQRERWVVPTADWGADLAALAPLDLLVRAEQVRQQAGMPQHVFLHVASEPKPYYIDFANPFCLGLLQQLLLNNPQATFTEMLPGPEELWLQEGQERFCCEFRMTACRY